MKIKFICLFYIFVTLIINVFPCPIWAGPRKLTHSGSHVQHQCSFQDDQQWPLSQWGGSDSDNELPKNRVRRKDSDLIPLDIEVFRRENMGPKPVWKEPNMRQEQKRKHEDGEE